MGFFTYRDVSNAAFLVFIIGPFLMIGIFVGIMASAGLTDIYTEEEYGRAIIFMVSKPLGVMFFFSILGSILTSAIINRFSFWGAVLIIGTLLSRNLYVTLAICGLCFGAFAGILFYGMTIYGFPVFKKTVFLLPEILRCKPLGLIPYIYAFLFGFIFCSIIGFLAGRYVIFVENNSTFLFLSSALQNIVDKILAGLSSAWSFIAEKLQSI